MGYGTRFALHFGKKLTKSTREQVIGALLASAIVVYQIHYGVIDRAHESGAYWSLAWPYLILVGVLLIWHLIRTPMELDAELKIELAGARSREDVLATRLKEIEDARPNIVLCDPGAMHVAAVSVNRDGIVVFIADVLRVRFINKPSEHTQNSVAREIGAKIRFYNPSGELILRMDGRWTDSSQPTREHSQSRNDLLPIDFRIAEEHSLDIGFVDTAIGQFIALNNDNFLFQRWRKPEHVLSGHEFKVEIELVGVSVNKVFSFQFTAKATGEIEIA